jgi:hypothetical protein
MRPRLYNIAHRSRFSQMDIALVERLCHVVHERQKPDRGCLGAEEGLHTRATLPTDRCHLNNAAIRIRLHLHLKVVGLRTLLAKVSGDQRTA